MSVIARFLALGSMLSALFAPGLLHAAAFRVLDQSASAVAQGNAFVAQADDPSAVFYNPAGMTQLPGVQLSTGGLLVGGRTTFANPAGATTSGNFGGAVALPPPANFYLTANLKDLGIRALGDVTLGLAVLSPFGIQVQVSRRCTVRHRRHPHLPRADRHEADHRL